MQRMLVMRIRGDKSRNNDRGRKPSSNRGRKPSNSRDRKPSNRCNLHRLRKSRRPIFIG